MRILLITACCFILHGRLNAQSKPKDVINYCLVHADLVGNALQGLDLCDSNKMILVIMEYGPDIDTNFVGFNSKGQIDYVKTQFEESSIRYNNNRILKEVTRYYPSSIIKCEENRITYEFQKSKEGYVESMKIICGKTSRLLTFKHQVVPVGRLVDVYDGNTLLRRNLFVFNDKGAYFKWEIINNEVVILKFNRDRFGVATRLENNNKYQHVIIEKGTFDDPKMKSGSKNEKDKYSIFDASGNVIGTIRVERASR